MLNIILFDNDARNHLLPLTATRPICELRIGITTIREKWERRLNAFAYYITQDYLVDKYPFRIEDENLIIAGNLVPTSSMVKAIEQLNMHEALVHKGELLAARLGSDQMEALINEESIHEIPSIEVGSEVEIIQINHLWEITRFNDRVLRDDFMLLTEGRKSQPLPSSNRVRGGENIFIEKGAKVEHCILNAETGPIYIGKNAEIMEGCMLRGPIALCEGVIIKMGAKIYGPTTFGPHSRGGGEISRSILTGYSNKGHDGFLGDSILGEWCNLGADTNNSNLKNNYGEVKLWDYATSRFEPTGEQFCGLVMGDHSKCGINTMFNTGTVVGVMCNLYGAGYPRNFVPDFSWGSPDAGYRTYLFDQAVQTAESVMGRRGVKFTDLDKAILYHVYDRTAAMRPWDSAVTQK